MRLKLQCTLKLKTDAQDVPVVEDVNLIDLPDNMTDAQVKAFFESMRNNMKKKYLDQILNFFEVELKQV
jgi:ABC-type transporter MlaC component